VVYVDRVVRCVLPVCPDNNFLTNIDYQWVISIVATLKRGPRHSSMVLEWRGPRLKQTIGRHSFMLFYFAKMTIWWIGSTMYARATYYEFHVLCARTDRHLLAFCCMAQRAQCKRYAIFANDSISCLIPFVFLPFVWDTLIQSHKSALAWHFITTKDLLGQPYLRQWVYSFNRQISGPANAISHVCVFVQELLKQITFDLDNYFNTLV